MCQHAEQDIVMAFLSVCPPVCSMLLLCLNEWTYCQTFCHSGRAIVTPF